MQDGARQGKVENSRAAHCSAGLHKQGTVAQGRAVEGGARQGRSK